MPVKKYKYLYVRHISCTTCVQSLAAGRTFVLCTYVWHTSVCVCARARRIHNEVCYVDVTPPPWNRCKNTARRASSARAIAVHHRTGKAVAEAQRDNSTIARRLLFVVPGQNLAPCAWGGGHQLRMCLDPAPGLLKKRVLWPKRRR